MLVWRWLTKDNASRPNSASAGFVMGEVAGYSIKELGHAKSTWCQDAELSVYRLTRYHYSFNPKLY